MVPCGAGVREDTAQPFELGVVELPVVVAGDGGVEGDDAEPVEVVDAVFRFGRWCLVEEPVPGTLPGRRGCPSAR